MIVVTAPTGAIGRQLLAGLLDRGEKIRVIARDPVRIPDGVRERVEVVPGSHGDREVVTEAFAGADTVFWLVPLDPRSASLEAAFVEFTRPACAALVSEGVRRVVGISALGHGFRGNAGLVSASHAMDDLIADTGVSYRALAMPAFMENMLMHVAAIKERGVFCSPIEADRALPTVATRDVAAVAAGLLLDPLWTGTGSVPVPGPEDLSFNDIARIVSETLGRTVRYQQVSAGVFKDLMTGSGMSEPMAQGMVDMLVAKNDGLDDIAPGTTRSATPTRFRTWCEDVLKPAVLA
jgi:uncharacterized protein YbjT (DUF2867 family)